MVCDPSTQDDQKLVADETQHSLLHHRRDSAGREKNLTMLNRGEKKGREKLETLAHLNCLNSGLVDLLKTSSYDVHLVNLFLRLKSLIGNWGVAHL